METGREWGGIWREGDGNWERMGWDLEKNRVRARETRGMRKISH